MRETSRDKGSRQQVSVQSHMCKGSTWHRVSGGRTLHMNSHGWKLWITTEAVFLLSRTGRCPAVWPRHIISIFKIDAMHGSQGDPSTVEDDTGM